MVVRKWRNDGRGGDVLLVGGNVGEGFRGGDWDHIVVCSPWS